MPRALQNLRLTAVSLVPHGAIEGSQSVLTYLEKTSADKTLPTTLPRCGTLFTYGSALVIRIFLSPGIGRIFLPVFEAMFCVTLGGD